MSTPRRILVIEDQEIWKFSFRRDLLKLLPDCHIEGAGGLDTAIRKVAGGAYDLIILDLILPRREGDQDEEELGPELARAIRADPNNHDAGLLIATAYSTVERSREAFFTSEADDFIDKYRYTPQAFLASVRAALRASALRRARDGASQEVRLEIELGTDAVMGARLLGPRRAAYPCRSPLPLDVPAWVERGDAVNRVLLGEEPEGWRGEVREIGSRLFELLSSAPELSAGLAAARNAGHPAGEISIHLHGPPSVLGVPFEMMRDGNGEYLVFRHQLARSVTAGTGVVRGTARFADLVEAAAAPNGPPLRVLVVGANTDGKIPAAEAEARHVAESIPAELDRLGARCEVTALIGADATLANVKDVLSAGETHVFHYAGHGRFEDGLPEVSGLVLAGPHGPRSLRASDLYLLCRDGKLHLAFLSCCLGARSAPEPGAGDLGGMFDALAQADVSTILGYRWVVNDRPALMLASAFYRWLCRTLSPSRALFRARAETAQLADGWNDETWLSPVLVLQNP